MGYEVRWWPVDAWMLGLLLNQHPLGDAAALVERLRDGSWRPGSPLQGDSKVSKAVMAETTCSPVVATCCCHSLLAAALLVLYIRMQSCGRR